jgi:betaine/carnitine transporter, BCCT family
MVRGRVASGEPAQTEERQEREKSPMAQTDVQMDPSVEYEIGQDNIQATLGPFGLDIHNPVFMISGLGIIAFVLGTLMFPEGATTLFLGVQGWLTANFDWFFLLAGNIFVVFGILLILTPLGSVRLGGPDARPDYSYFGWFAMLFAAGMGIGIMFFGVAEPLSHFGAAVAEGAGAAESWAPLGGAAGDPAAAARLSMAATIYHWALHPWAMYAVVALALAFFSYNRGMPLSIRSAFFPIFGNHVWGRTGHVIDTVAVFATLFGLATSLGFGAEQAAAGLNFLFGMPQTDVFKVLLILGITGVATISVLAGLDSGVKRASEINMVLALLLFLFVLFVGPTATLLAGFAGSIGAYVVELPALANPFGRADDNFREGWTAFYWAWWISWSPFVGMFIARVSRGRTVREFMVCVLLIPSLVCALWMSVFGGTAIHQVASDGYQGAAEAATELQLFAMLSQLPLTGITSLIGIILVVVFFVTSSDSGSLVIDTITAGGKTDGPMPQRVFWCCLEGLVAVALLLGGGLAALQAMAVATGFPFAVLLLLMCVAIWMGLRAERRGVALK